MKKKVLFILTIAVLLIVGTIVVSRAAGENVVFEVPNKNVVVDQTIEVPINIDCSKKLVAFNMNISYDSDVLQFLPYTNSSDYLSGSIAENGGMVLVNETSSHIIKVGFVINPDSTINLQNQSGNIIKLRFKGIAAGNSAITATVSSIKDENGATLSNSFKSGNISVLNQNSISLNKTNLEIEVGQNDTITLNSSNATIYEDITWSSSNASVARIEETSQKNVITVRGLSEGTATITANVLGIEKTCSVSVNDVSNDYSITIDDPEWSILPVKQIRRLTVTFDPASYASGKTVQWSSSNTAVATIDNTGTITAKSVGTTTITATVEDKVDTFDLTVRKNLGDIDDDGIDSYDAYKALVLALDISLNNPVNANDVVVLDVNRDGNMEPDDAYRILKYNVGIITALWQ